MNKEEIIDKTIQFVAKELEHETTGHDWWHINRVLKLSEKIAGQEGGDIFKIKMIALLHDIADYKLNEQEEEGVKKLTNYLNNTFNDHPIKQEIINDIYNLSYKGANVVQQQLSLEGKIVQDADRLDAIGAIGIARAFAYGGNKNRSMHDPDEAPNMHNSFEEYKLSKGSTINHFHEKLLLLKDRMNTTSAKKLAEQRHIYMSDFLKQFYAEWEAR